MAKQKTPQTTATIETVSLYETARQRYLNYALSVITSRALPDVRDGMKPVQRRILYGMHEMHLTHEAKYQKSAQVVGQVMGRYHPHGDSAIYDAMVRMAQPFTMRYPFVDGQGNFGSLDGDSAAAMRYTEARLQPVASAMLEDLDEHIVDFMPNYSGTFKEPTVLPTAIPALLVNGSMGIAVGMATNVPPHNLAEVVDGCVALIDNPEMSLDDLMEYVPGPDFPTGGRILTSSDDIKKVYETGRGAIDIQADYTVEQEGKRSRIIVTSMPYTVNKAALVKTIGDLIGENKLPLLTNIRDESTDVVRVVLELRQGADPNAVMAYLFKHTALQTRFNVNITCIVPGEGDQMVYQPKRLGLKECMMYFNRFRLEVITRRLQYQLSQLLERIHILEGYMKLFGGLDEAIAIIRNSEDKPAASAALCARFEIDEIQAEAILQLRLYRLARLEIDKIESELASKNREAAHIRSILASEKKLWKVVRDELENVKKNYGDDRRTRFEGEDLSDDYSPEKYIIDEECYVIVTRSGLFKRQKSYTDVSSIRTRENDAIAFIRRGTTRSTLMLLSSAGKAYTMLADNVPATTGHGTPIATVFKLEDGETIVGAYIIDQQTLNAEPPKPKPADLIEMMDESAISDAACIVAISRMGQIVRLPLEPFTAVSTASGRIYMRLNDGDAVMTTCLPRTEQYVSLISDNTRANVFKLMDVPSLKTAGKGYRALSLDPGTVVMAARLVNTDEDGVRVRLSDRREIVISARRMMLGERGGKGRLLLRRGKVDAVLDDQNYDIDLPPQKTDEQATDNLPKDE